MKFVVVTKNFDEKDELETRLQLSLINLYDKVTMAEMIQYRLIRKKSHKFHAKLYVKRLRGCKEDRESKNEADFLEFKQEFEVFLLQVIKSALGG
ncbi:5701_t:CDS:2 [Gigaspora margarita]|uniref:5701_t:CDS:1 n=1 Tax=Gigaspora margarita TaxID=4874 RepID=A0ABN7VQY6_GIGMA|nr:5701_t:CDS:2 [Gigaspora margarita]